MLTISVPEAREKRASFALAMKRGRLFPSQNCWKGKKGIELRKKKKSFHILFTLVATEGGGKILIKQVKKERQFFFGRPQQAGSDEANAQLSFVHTKKWCAVCTGCAFFSRPTGCNTRSWSEWWISRQDLATAALMGLFFQKVHIPFPCAEFKNKQRGSQNHGGGKKMGHDRTQLWGVTCCRQLSLVHQSRAIRLQHLGANSREGLLNQHEQRRRAEGHCGGP